MSRYFEVKDYTPQAGQEWMVASYPGDGAYVTTTGISFVRNGAVFIIPLDYVALLTSSPAASVSDSGLDVHRLVDQFLDRIAPRRT